jgi:hypothetical protein
MKPTVNSNSVLKTIAITATAAVLFAGSPLSSFANSIKEKHAKTASISESQIDVQYIGSDNNSFTFRVKFENTEAKKFTFIVKNDDGDVVYSKQYSDVHFLKTIYLNKDEIGGSDIHPTFAISTNKKTVERSFSIETTYSEDIMVTKL